MNRLNIGLLMQPGQITPGLDELTPEQSKMMKLSMLYNAFGNISNLGQGRPNESFIPGMLAMSSMFTKENAKKKTAQQMQEAFKGAMIPPVPPQYMVNNKSFTDEASAKAAAAPYDTTVGMYGGGLTSGLDSMTGQGAPSQYKMRDVSIPESPVDYKPGNPGGFDMSKAMMALMQTGNPDLMTTGLEAYAKMMPEAGKPQLVDVFDPKQGKTVKRWVRPGESTGVDVGLAPPKEGSTSAIGKLIAERDALPEGDPRRAAYDNAIKKATTHQPPVTIANYGSLMPAVNTATGEEVLLQPSNRGGAREIAGYTTPASAEKSAKAKAASESRLTSLDSLEQDVLGLLNHPGLDKAVGWGTVTPTLPESDKADAITEIENLGSRAAINTINEMKQMSASGGAVGQVSEKEWPKLEAAFANLNRKQSPEQFKKNLNKALQQLRESRRLVNNAAARQPGAQRQTPKAVGADMPPPGISPEEWQYLSPEDKALWMK